MSRSLTKLAQALIPAVAILAASGAAQAADVQVYGRIDTGLIYHNYGGDSTASDTFTMNSGVNTSSRVGIQGSEALTDETKVIFRLESRFTSDTGAFNSYSGQTNRMFGGQSTVGIVNQTYGEVTFGRVAGIASSTGPYDFQGYMDAFGGGTNGTGNTPINSSRHDNMISYRTPWFAGLQATFQYSLKSDGNDSGDEAKSGVNRFFDAGLHYKAGQLHLVAVYEQLIWGHDTQLNDGASEDRKVATIGGSYRFEPVTIYAQAQYFKGLNSVDGFGSDDLTDNSRDGQIEGYGIYAGAEFWFGASSWKWMAYWRDYELQTKALGDHSGDTIGIATKYVYRPSKTVDLYVGGGFSRWDRLASESAGVKTYTDQDINAYFGVTKYF